MFAWYPEFEPYFAHIQLVLLMLGMGATLRVGDFVEVVRKPRSFFSAYIGQVVAIPFLAVGINFVFGLEGGVAVGMILVASMPGGAMSKLFTYLGRGNVPLSITLAAFTTLSSVIFVPLWLNLLAAAHVPEGFTVPPEGVMMEVGLYLVLPVIVGMIVGRRFPLQKGRFAKICVRLGLIVVVVMVAGSLGSGRIRPGEHGLKLPTAIVLLCLLGMQLNQLPFYLFGWPRADRMSAGVEVTLRNMNLALLLYTQFFTQDERLGGGVLFVILFYAAVAMFAGVPLTLRHRMLAAKEEAALEGG